MLSFKTVSHVDHFLGIVYIICPSTVGFRGLFTILYLVFGFLCAYKGYLMYRNLQPSLDKAPLNVADIKLCKRYMVIHFLLTVISFGFIFTLPSIATTVSYMVLIIVLEIYASAPLKKVFEGIF